MKTRIQNYQFDKTSKTVTLTDYADVSLEAILLITNVATGQILYNFADPALGATVAGNVITLEFDTTGMTNSDALQIYYDDPATEATNVAEQIEIRELMVGLLEVARLLAFLPSMRDTANQLRVGIVSGSVGISSNSTLATLSNISNVGGFSAQQQIPAGQNVAAVISNINNVTIA